MIHSSVIISPLEQIVWIARKKRSPHPFPTDAVGKFQSTSLVIRFPTDWPLLKADHSRSSFNIRKTGEQNHRPQHLIDCCERRWRITRRDREKCLYCHTAHHLAQTSAQSRSGRLSGASLQAVELYSVHLPGFMRQLRLIIWHDLFIVKNPPREPLIEVCTHLLFAVDWPIVSSPRPSCQVPSILMFVLEVS